MDVIDRLRLIARGFMFERVTTAQARSAAPTIEVAATEIVRLRARLDDALFVLGMVDKNNRIDAGEKGKAWSGRFVGEEVRRVLSLGLGTEQRHGVNCEKASHHGGNLHNENDDAPFEVDGVNYCGRCHKAL